MIQPRKHIYFNFTLWQSACGFNPGNCIYVAFVPCALPTVQKSCASDICLWEGWFFTSYLSKFLLAIQSHDVFEAKVVDNE